MAQPQDKEYVLAMQQTDSWLVIMTMSSNKRSISRALGMYKSNQAAHAFIRKAEKSGTQQSGWDYTYTVARLWTKVGE